jgi:hypothetical protein
LKPSDRFASIGNPGAPRIAAGFNNPHGPNRSITNGLPNSR